MNTKVTAKAKMQMRQTVSLAAFLALLCATGCKNFFPPNTTTTAGGATVVNTGDYAYIASANTSNPASPIYTLSGFSVGTGTLAALSGFPLTLDFPPATAVVTPSNALLYISGSEVVYGYTISSAGALTSILNADSTQPLANANIVSMVVSPDGNWLLALDGTVVGSIITIHAYPISSAGQLGTDTPVQYSLTGGGTIIPSGIAVSPNGDYVAVALGTGGDVLFSFATSNGALTYAQEEIPPTTSSADQAVAFDSTSSILFVARSGTDAGLVPYTIGVSNSTTTLTAAAGAPFALGGGPSSMLVDSTGKYLYVGNKTDSNISGFSIGTGGVLKPLSGSPFAAGTNVSALGEENSGKYILSTSLGAPDLKLYTLDTTTAGNLDATTTTTTGDPTEPAGALAIALTHPSTN